MSARRSGSASRPSSCPDRVGRDLAERAPDRRAHAADHVALMRQQIFRDLPTLVLDADKVFLRYRERRSKNVSQNGDLPEISRIGFVETPGEAMSNSRKLMPSCFFALRVRADKAEDPIRLVGIRGPDLLAVDEVMVALVLGPGLQRSEIGAGTRFRIALAPADFAAHDLRQMYSLLLRLTCRTSAAPARASRARKNQAATRQPKRAHFRARSTRASSLDSPPPAIGGRPFRSGPAARGHAVEPQLSGPVDLKVARCVRPSSGRHRRCAGVRMSGGAIRIEPRARLSDGMFRDRSSLQSLISNGLRANLVLPQGCPDLVILRNKPGPAGSSAMRLHLSTSSRPPCPSPCGLRAK